MFIVTLYKKIFHFFDKLEDHVRGWISKRPVLFGMVGGIAVVEFWRGVWNLTDFVMSWLGFDEIGLVSGVFSFLLGTVIMLSTGLYVSLFVGDSIILSGIKKEKKFFEKTADELKEEDDRLGQMYKLLQKLDISHDEMKKHFEIKHREHEIRMENLEKEQIKKSI
jgi:predicted amino acid-binding ACT domain protein